ncbi:MAG: class I SAM-dependent methyltransferase [Gammaproteobacteria bacterium]|nr:MAG: class I SAM-dependent methyltransferase [Gammaproteobacteria bacterium]TDJ36600.1 MAG: class I SAM-dependent methyltransferase [Gammaproteobacteria bacterium]
MMPDQSFRNIDAGRAIDWGKTSRDYDRYRPGPPDSFYRKLLALNIGLPGQHLLDLGTGTGLLARRFASEQVEVSGIDISASQIEMASSAAVREGLTIEFNVAVAEDLPFPDQSFDVVTANQCWMYFDLSRAIPEVRRVLRPGGQLLVSHFSFMPHLDPLVRASEKLVLKYNPDWSGADWDGLMPPQPRWSREDFNLVGLFVYDEQIPFTRDSWRGRMRALRGIAASLSEQQVMAFDQEHEALLSALAADRFDVWHRIHAQLFQPQED